MKPQPDIHPSAMTYPTGTYCFVFGLYTNSIASPTTDAFAVAIFPPVATPAVPANSSASMCVCVTGGVMVAIAVLPVSTVRKLLGATVVPEANVFGDELFTGFRAAQSDGVRGMIYLLFPLSYQ